MANILTIGKYYPPFEGGTEIYTQNICERLARKHNVTALVFNHNTGTTIENIRGVRVIRCKSDVVWNSQPLSLSMLRRLDLRDIDLIHFHAPNFFMSAALILSLMTRKRRIPLIVTHHVEVYGRRAIRAMVLPLYKMLASRADAVIVNSLKNAGQSKDLPSSANVIAIPGGIDLDKFVVSEERRALAVTWIRSLVGDAPAVAFVGRHARFKGLEVLIRALPQLQRAHLLIAGDGPVRAKAEAIAAELGVGDRAHFLGVVDDNRKLALIAAADVFAFPSTETTETLGVAQMEAMAIGTPVVASNLPTGVTDVAIDGQTALLATPGDSADLATKIQALLSDKVLAARLSAGALQHLRQSFSLTQSLERTELLFDWCLSREKEPAAVIKTMKLSELRC